MGGWFLSRRDSTMVARLEGHLESSARGDLCPEGGYRAQPRVSTLGNLKINELALKGREVDLIKLAPNAAPKIRVRN
jgi:hypothetical protein